METIITSLLPFMVDVWPYAAFSIIMAVVSELFETEIIPLWNGAKFGIWPRRLQAFFPIIIGALLGAVLETSVKNTGLRCLAFAGAGAVGVVLFDVVRAWLDKRGITIKLPGTSSDTQEPKK